MEEEQEINPTEDQNQSEAPNGAPETNAGQVDESDEPDIAMDEAQEEEKSTPDENQRKLEKAEAAFRKKINAYARHRNEEREAREAAEQKAKELEDRIKAFEQQQQQIKIPPLPDPLDEDYNEKIAMREKALRQASAYDAKQQFIAEQKQKQEHEAKLKAQQEAEEKTRKVYEAAIKYGIDQDQLKVAEDRLTRFIPRTNGGVMLANYILEHEKSPLLIKYLGDNASEAEKIAGMNPIRAAMYINDKVLKSAEKLRPKISNAPDPVKSPSGRGAPKSENRFLKGVVME